MELVKSMQSIFIQSDIEMYDPVSNQSAKTQSVLHEDLGNIGYIFSDKTGTFTANEMRVRAICTFSSFHLYGDTSTEIEKRVKTVSRRAIEERQRPKTAARVKPLSHAPWTSLAVSNESGAAVSAADDEIAAATHAEITRALADTSPAHASEAQALRLLLVNLALSNSIKPTMVTIDAKNDDDAVSNDGAAGVELTDTKERTRIDLQSQSPDETAMCTFAQQQGFHLTSRRPATLLVSGRGDDYETSAAAVSSGNLVPELYDRLATLDFTSKRRRATFIYQRRGTDAVVVMCKGADSAMLPLFAENANACDGNDDNAEEDDKQPASSYAASESDGASAAADADALTTLSEKVNAFSKNGLRCFVIGCATRDAAWWATHAAAVAAAVKMPDAGTELGHSRGICGADCRVCETLTLVEKDAHLAPLGIVTIEDKLQALVPECVEDFLAAGIKVWMLTGDKEETAKNVALGECLTLRLLLTFTLRFANSCSFSRLPQSQ
jgi:magnesium-transporting ATPase (P-type)